MEILMTMLEEQLMAKGATQEIFFVPYLTDERLERQNRFRYVKEEKDFDKIA